MIHYNPISKEQKELYTLSRFEVLEGLLSQQESFVTLADFLRHNLGVTTELLLGIKIFPYQEFILQNWFENNFNINVVSRGGAKSWMVALFALLYPIFYPNTRIVFASAVFRSARRIMEQMEQFLQMKGASMLRDCYPDGIRRATDQWQMKANGGIVIAVPLNNKIRGIRADILVVDEFLLVPENIYKDVLMPFLTAKNNIQEQLSIIEKEEELIRLGKLTEADKTILESNKKIIALTSASFDFEYCHTIYQDWLLKAADKKKAEGKRYFTAKLSYLSLPKELVEETIIQEAKSGGENTPYFQREYMANFVSGSDGFFSMKHMRECTIPDGDLPCVQLSGDPKAEYILAIDPSFSSGAKSDFFAMGVWMLDQEKRRITLVNSYAIAGGDLKNHIAYLYYILRSFNIVLVTADLLGGGGENFNFIEAVNQSQLFTISGLQLKFVEAQLNDCGEDYAGELRAFKRNYNPTTKTICYAQKFTNTWVRKANEYLQHQIQAKKVWFSSKVCNHSEEFEKVCKKKFPEGVRIYNSDGKEYTVVDFVEDQDYWIEETMNQIALIEPRKTASGSVTFDLAPAVKAIKGENRARRDNYTTTLMACWAAKFYFDYKEGSILNKFDGFKPFFIN